MLTLRYSTTSPFVRKVSVTIIECGLEDQVINEPTNPWAPDTDLPQVNPLGKVPALVIENGEVLFDSPVICEYLDNLSAVPKLLSPDGKERWDALRLQAIGDGMMDAAISRILESRREPQQQSEAVVTRSKAVLQRSLALLDRSGNSLGLENGFQIGQITIACALEYLDFRFGDEDWRADYPALDAWHQSCKNRPSLVETAPHE